MREVYRASIGLLALLILSPYPGMSVVHAQQEKQQLLVSTTHSTIQVSLGEAFTLHIYEPATIKGEDLEIRITRFYNSPCPPKVRCFWSGVGIRLQYRHGGETQHGIGLAQAFGYKTTIIATDHESYATLKVEKIEQQTPDRLERHPDNSGENRT